MIDFTYYSPTEIIFGKDCHMQAGERLRAMGAQKILLHYGGASIKRSGLYDQITAGLRAAGVDFAELGGVQPNPRLGLVKEGIALCRKEGVDLVLAVGGGSVIDSAKAIALGTPFSGDVWDIFLGKAQPTGRLPVVTVLTIPAAGSESSPSAVITNEEGWLKRGLTHPLNRPVLSFLNPALCRTLPDAQVRYGASDIMAHLMERYFTNTDHVDLSDRLLEGALRTMLIKLPAILKDKEDVDTWAEIMWTGMVAHNGILGMGREEDWASHGIEHELSALYDIAHGAGLSIVFPAWMKYVYKANVGRFVQFAVRVFDVSLPFADPEAIALEGIARLEAFYRSVGLPTRLADVGIDGARIPEMAEKAAFRGGWLGHFVSLTAADIAEIYLLAL